MKRLVVVYAALLAGCVHQLPIPDVSNDMKQLDAAAQSRCANSGYQAGTPAFNQCVYAVKSQFIQSVMVPVPESPSIAPPRPITTNCSGNAYSASCTTY